MAPGGLGNFLSRLVSGGKAHDADSGEPRADAPVAYKDFEIVAAPRHEGGQWIVAGTIRKSGDAGTREHHFIRADSYSSRDGAAEFTVVKAKQMIDLEGDHLFDKASAW